MTAPIEVRRARLSDAESIAAFVNAAFLKATQSQVPDRQPVTGAGVVARFGQVGFIIAEQECEMVGLLGWQIENLVVRVTDYLVALSGTEARMVARSLVEKMESEAKELLVESALLFLPARPSATLLSFWQRLGYEAERLEDLDPACREAVSEWGLDAEHILTKRLREDLVGRPI